jgi:hypothetical protein
MATEGYGVYGTGYPDGKGGGITCSNKGDPLKYQLPICGVMFRFDEGGNVYHPKYEKPVGTLHCVLATKC